MFLWAKGEKKKKFALVSSNQGLGHRSFFSCALWKWVKKKSEAAHKDSVCFYSKHGFIVMIYDAGPRADGCGRGDSWWRSAENLNSRDFKYFHLLVKNRHLLLGRPVSGHDTPPNTPLASLEADDKVVQDWSINSIRVSKMISSDWQFLHIFAS